MARRFKDFDLPAQHLSMVDAHHVPRRARNQDEADRRRARPAGALILEAQLHGIQMSADVLRQLDDKSGITFASRVIALAGLNSAYYTYPKGGVMRRRLSLPNMFGADGEAPPTAAEHRQAARQSLREATIAAEGLTLAADERERRPHRMALGRHLGETSLLLACTDLTDILPLDSERAAALVIRDYSMQILNEARAASYEFGTPPSMAQFPDPHSDVSIYINRVAPNDAQEAFEVARAIYGIPA
jgi:hypothetical protein